MTCSIHFYYLENEIATIATLLRMTRVKKILSINVAAKNIWLNEFNKKRDCLRSTFTVINGLYLMGYLAYKELLKKLKDW